MGWLKGVLVAIDQLGNAIAGGNPDVTISARTGYFANVFKTNLRFYWKSLEYIIDFTFYPIDGPNHCYQAYLADKEEEKHKLGSDIMRLILSLITIIACIPISIFARIYVLVFPKAKYKKV